MHQNHRSLLDALAARGADAYAVQSAAEEAERSGRSMRDVLINDRVVTEQELTEALADLDRSIAINPKQSNVFAERGTTYLTMTQTDKALADYDQALALDRFNEQARAARGLALMFKGNTAEALPDLNNVLEKNPNNLAALLGRGLAMITSAQYDRAIVALNQVVGKTADDSMARLLRARAYLLKKDANGAMPDLTNLDDGNMRFTTDFRRVYATMPRRGWDARTQVPF